MPRAGGNSSGYYEFGGFDNFIGWLDNLFTGNREFERQQVLMNQQSAINAAEAEKARQAQLAENERSRAYQTEMSNTAYQRAASDLRAAGFNPANVIGSGGASGGTMMGISGTAGSVGLPNAKDSRNMELLEKAISTANTASSAAANAVRTFGTIAAMAISKGRMSKWAADLTVSNAVGGIPALGSGALTAGTRASKYLR